jgi:hypothetical protein
MNIEELITKLQEIRSEHGNLEVYNLDHESDNIYDLKLSVNLVVDATSYSEEAVKYIKKNVSGWSEDYWIRLWNEAPNIRKACKDDLVDYMRRQRESHQRGLELLEKLEKTPLSVIIS